MARKRPAGDSARPRRIRPGARLSAWRRHHSQSAADSLSKVLQQPIASAMTWLVIGIAIALPAGLWVLLNNAAQVTARLESPAQFSVFMKDGSAADTTRALGLQLKQRSDVLETVFIDRNDALVEFAQSSGMGVLVSALPENPLPHLLLVTPVDGDPGAVTQLQTAILAIDDVQEVVIDNLWLQRLAALMGLGRRAVQLISLLLLAAVVLVLGNTIRLAIESRRDEIVISKLVGGSDAFVRRPLLYTGLWFGIGGGVVAALLVALGVLLLSPPVARIAMAYDSTFSLQGLNLVDSLQLVLIGAGLGLIGAWLAVARHLRAIEPQ